MAIVALKTETAPARSGDDVVRVRHLVRMFAVELGFSLVEQTKVVTAASEIARNTVHHGGGGEATIEMVSDNGRRGLRMVFADKGPGIPDVAQALKDGFSTGGGLGLGLGGARRLCSDLSVESRPGEGTRVTVIRWK